MRSKDRARLHAAAFLLGAADGNGSALDPNVMDGHDWSTYLLAKDMEPKGYKGPDWVPFCLWSAREWSGGMLKECVEKLIYDAGAREVWTAIQSTYDEPNTVAQSLPAELARVRDKWQRTSTRTPAKHREHLLQLQSNALALAREIERIEALDALDTGERFDFMRLYSAEEKLIVYQNIRMHNLQVRNTVLLEAKGRKFGFRPGDFAGTFTPQDWASYNTPEEPNEPESPLNHSLAGQEAFRTWELLLGDGEEWPGIVPTPAATLRRLATYFETESSRPAMQRPTFENAERNFVARHLCQYFRDSFGFVSPAIVARLISMFYPQGITDNEVSQMIKKIPGGNLPLQWPENSPLS